MSQRWEGINMWIHQPLTLVVCQEVVKSFKGKGVDSHDPGGISNFAHKLICFPFTSNAINIHNV